MSSGEVTSKPSIDSTSEALAALGKSLDLSGKELHGDFFATAAGIRERRKTVKHENRS